MIKSFRDRATESIFLGNRVRGLPGDIQQRVRSKLRMLDAATIIEDLLIPPSNRLEKLKGSRRGQYSIRVNKQWRICFMWRDANAHNVEIADYH